MKTFFSADHHFGHKNILKYADRPFSSVQEMNAELIKRHNSVVSPNDSVYFVGDFAFMQPHQIVNILRQMNGRKYFIPGNHDKSMNDASVKSEFERFYPFDSHPKIRVQDDTIEKGYQEIVLCHFAMRVWDKSHHGVWNLYGHSHGSLDDDPNALAIDVGVDVFDFYPVEYQEVKKIMAKKTWKPIDHHGAD